MYRLNKSDVGTRYNNPMKVEQNKTIGVCV